jgi:hypothetical protein
MNGRPLRPRLAAILTTWPFILSLVILVLNDSWLKQAWPGTVTGKLSDFAGIALITLLLLAAAPKHSRLVCAGIATAFALWKSPLSQPLIDVANLHLPFRIGRVVDYLDLIALGVLPLCELVARNTPRFAIRMRGSRRLLIPPLTLATVFAVSATSMIPTMREYRFTQRNPAAELNHTVVATAVAEAADKLDLACTDCTETHVKGSYEGEGLSFTYSFPDARTVFFEVQAFDDGLFIFAGDSGDEKVERLRDQLQKRLNKTYLDLEFDERLGRRH